MSLNNLAKNLYAKRQQTPANGVTEPENGTLPEPKTEQEDNMEVDEPSSSSSSSSSSSDSSSSSQSSEGGEDVAEEPVEEPPVKRKIGRKPARRHRPGIRAVREFQNTRNPAYRKTTLFKAMKQVRDELHAKEIKFSTNTVELLPLIMENLMIPKAQLANRLALSTGKTTVLPRHLRMAMKLVDKPDLTHWTTKDFSALDLLLEKSQFRNTDLDVDSE